MFLPCPSRCPGICPDTCSVPSVFLPLRKNTVWISTKFVRYNQGALLMGADQTPLTLSAIS